MSPASRVIAAEIRRTARVIEIKKSALAAAEALKPQPLKRARPVFVIPARHVWLLPKIRLLRDRPRA